MLDHSSTLIHYPGIKMSRFGLIPEEFGGGPKFRIIWAPSRMLTLTGQEKVMTVSMYFGPYAIENVGEEWIMESWKTPYEYAGNKTREQWERDPLMLNLGPYPSRGEFVRRETFNGSPANADIGKMVMWLEEKRTEDENFYFTRDDMEQKLVAKKKQRDAMLRDAMCAFGGEASSGPGGGRGTKTVNLQYSQEDLRLPGSGQTAARNPKRRPVFEVVTS